VASIHAQKNRVGNAYRVLWRADGRQRSLTFENLPAAERSKTLLEVRGPDEALRIVELDEIGRHVPTVTEWLHAHIDNLTGVQSATLALYRSYVARDVDPVFGSMPVSAVNETTIALWVKQLGGSGKTISNKHGLLSGRSMPRCAPR
jgi:integrase